MKPDTNPCLIAVFGASNVTVSLPTIVSTAFRAQTPPSEIAVGHGPGRSYGTVAGCFLYSYPGLLKCGLLDHCRRFRQANPHAPIQVLLTDIGNDLALTGQNRALHFWLDKLISRLEALNARIMVSRLPVASVTAMPRWKFNILRHIYFPFADTGFDQIKTLVTETQTQLDAWAAAGRFTSLATEPHWYTIDHFHLAFFRRKRVFHNWLAQLLGPIDPARRLGVSSLKLRLLPMKRYWRMRTRKYPASHSLELDQNCHLFYY
ncbi:hypothetical protein [Acanthopleuribacter pedis]|uniref:Uncharacterized protein n=1 Tax=Acanthopleuribacter pedis TaxID=442870 RepID=A0A8J7QDF9_9BACT|nr:hypothetical protein [Acanthopleuribacter pedis]MBO1317570.1 hypothetical protein [Acanthopleuribacter pedis]